MILLLVGAGLVVLGVGFALKTVPGGQDDLHAYQAAPRCGTAPSKPADCRWTETFTVSDVRLTLSRNDADRAFLTGADGVRWETEYTNRKPVLTDLKKGDRVTGTIWRGHVTEISAEGASQKTADAPADMRTRALIGALITVPSGLVLAAACAWRLARRSRPTRGMVATAGLAIALLFAGLFSPVIGGENLWTVAAIWVPVAAVMAGAARYYTVHTAQGSRARENAL